MAPQIAVFCIGLAISVVADASGSKPGIDPRLAVKNHALTVCLAKGLGPGPAADKAAAAAREYFEQGSLPIDAYTEAAKLADIALRSDPKNIYGDDLVFIKCLDLYNSKDLEAVVAKFSSGH